MTNKPEVVSHIEIRDPNRLCTNPLVSVVMITYNHEKWIGSAIEGVIMQQAEFSLELIIADDCSKDHTREIALEYQKKHPALIRVRFPDQNIGVQQNFIKTLQCSRGKYIAICEGDDYWTTPDKLQKQVAVMESHPECGMCVAQTNAFDVSKGMKTFLYTMRGPDRLLTFEDFLTGHPVHTSTYLIRARLLLDLLKIYSEYIMINDHTICLMLADIAPIFCLPEIVSTYQCTGAGVDSGETQKNKGLAYEKMYSQMYRYYKKERRIDFAKILLRSYYSWFVYYLRQERDSRRCLFRVGQMLALLMRHPSLISSVTIPAAHLVVRTIRGTVLPLIKGREQG